MDREDGSAARAWHRGGIAELLRGHIPGERGRARRCRPVVVDGALNRTSVRVPERDVTTTSASRTTVNACAPCFPLHAAGKAPCQGPTPGPREMGLKTSGLEAGIIGPAAPDVERAGWARAWQTCWNPTELGSVTTVFSQRRDTPGGQQPRSEAIFGNRGVAQW